MTTEWNGKKAIALAGVLVTAAGLIFGSGWLSAVRTEAAFKQRTESFIESHSNIDDEMEALRIEAAVGAVERRELRESQKELVEAMRRLTDQMALIIQRDMREGRIPR